MTRTLTLRRTGGSVGFTLPREVAERLHLVAGDEVFATDTQHGILITPYDQETQEHLDSAARMAKKWRSVLKKLADA